MKPAAVAHARDAIRRSGYFHEGNVEAQDATFVLPQLYCSVESDELFDRAAPARPYEGPRTRYTLLEDGIKGLREGFVGRRRAIQRLIPPLRDGDITFAVITGIGGAGKSTLATRAANLLETAGFKVLGVRAGEGNGVAARGRATLSKIHEAIGRAFLSANRRDLYELLINTKIPEEQRLRLAIDGLKELRVAVVLDNFEDVLTFKTWKIADPELASLFKSLALNLTKGSRVIVTCRYLPEETPNPDDQSNVAHVPLGDFDEHDFFKFLRRDPVVDTRVREGILPLSLLRTLFQSVGGTPRFLTHIRKVLTTIDPNALAEELSARNSDFTGAIEAERQKYFEHIFVERLYKALPVAARRAVSRLGLSELPLPVDAIVAIGELDEANAARSLRDGVAFGLLQQFSEPNLPNLYHPPGLLRGWLSSADRVDAAASKNVHGQLAAFWRSSFEKDREVELRVPVSVEVAVCRTHAGLGGDLPNFIWATVWLASRSYMAGQWREAKELLEAIPEPDRDGKSWLNLARVETSTGDWALAREHLERALPLLAEGAESSDALHSLASIDLNEGGYPAAREKLDKAMAIRQAIGDRAGEASTWHQLASIDLNEGNYPAAWEKLDKAMAIRQAIGDRAGEARTWHQLATIDVNEGNYPAAREKFDKSMAIKRAIGDRAGEAATWHQLGVLAIEMGRGEAGVRLVAICWLIDKSIGHGDTESDLRNFLGACAQLNYEEPEVHTAIQDAITAYQNDGAAGLLLEAFPPAN